MVTSPDNPAPKDDRLLQLGDLVPFGGSPFPVWVFDVDESRVIWANPVALDLWSAPSLADLQARDLGADMTSSAREQLGQFRDQLRHGRHFDTPWTIFPLGEPRTLLCRARGCVLQDGRVAMLIEGQPVAGETNLQPAMALLYSSVMVTTHAPGGACIYANPAALRAVPDGRPPALTRFRNPTLRAILTQDPGPASEGVFLSEVVTQRGPRIHEVEIRQSLDPLSGKRSFLITEIDVTEQEDAKRELARQASHDSLTGLLNRAYLTSAAPGYLAETARAGLGVALLMLDIDRFKFVNDTLGHGAGDRLLQEIGQRLLAALPEEAIIARLGGDEFCVLMATTDGEKEAQRSASAILKALRRPLRVEGQTLGITASIGFSLGDGATARFDDLLRQADLALFDAKGTGGHALRAFRPELAERSRRFVQIEADLREALSRNRLELFYQPRLSFQTGRIVAAEALIRLNSPSGSTVLPGEFIPVAEATGRIAAIGRWVLREAARDLAALRAAGNPINLAVNVSPSQFADPAFLTLLRQVRRQIGTAAGDIELEITEGMLVENDRRLQRVMQLVSRLGYKLMIDDFGTGYSNLSSLSRYPITCIKIDKSLIVHGNFRLLVTGVVTIARALGVRIVAEGVETPEQRDWLAAAGCDEFQGYVFSQPVPFAELQRLVAEGV